MLRIIIIWYWIHLKSAIYRQTTALLWFLALNRVKNCDSYLSFQTVSLPFCNMLLKTYVCCVCCDDVQFYQVCRNESIVSWKKNGGLILSLVQNINYKCRQLAVSLCVCGACIASLDRLSNTWIKITKQQQHTHTYSHDDTIFGKKCHFTTIELKHRMRKKCT